MNLFGRLFRRTSASAPKPQWPLWMPLLHWSKAEPFTLEDACKGLQIWGMTGSGKSSGSGKTIALSYLRHGFGGLVLCAKPGEADTWHDYARQTGRSNDLIVFSPTSAWRYNFLDHELTRPGAGAGLTENLLQLFLTITEIASRGSNKSGREDEGYWQRSLQQLLRNCIDLVAIATGRVSISDLYRLVISAPTSYEQVESTAWRTKSFCWQCLQQADAAPKNGYQAHDFQIVADYFLIEYPGLSDKTRSIIVSTFTSMADAFNRGVLRELFGTATNVTPEDCLAGRIVVVDLNVKEFAEIGRFAATIWKTQFQRAVERREERENPRPVFLFADESQLFTTKNDALFQTTARSARCCTVLLTQNISNYFSAYGGETGRADALSLLGNLTTVVVHALADSETAQYMAELIGRSLRTFANGNVSHTPCDPVGDFFGRDEEHASGGFSESFEYRVQPSEFCRLATGGPANNYRIEALVWRGGQPFRSTRRSYLWTTFTQRS